MSIDMQRKCVFFDRDGIVNRSPGAGYVERWGDFELLPDFVEVLRVLRARGYEAVIVSNQSGVARGVLTSATVDEIHENLRRLLREQYGLDVLDILYCPHDDGECECRKPQPGMLLTAARRHGIDLSRSWMVGDQERDIEAGRRAGCRAILVSDRGEATSADFVAEDMKRLQSMIADLL